MEAVAECESACHIHQPLNAAAAKSLQSCPTLCDPIDGSPPGSLSLGFSRQEHWSGLPFPSPKIVFITALKYLNGCPIEMGLDLSRGMIKDQ